MQDGIGNRDVLEERIGAGMKCGAREEQETATGITTDADTTIDNTKIKIKKNHRLNLGGAYGFIFGQNGIIQ